MIPTQRMRGLGMGKKNAASFVYEILHGQPRFIRRPMQPHRHKLWRGIPVDEHIPQSALDELRRIGEIEPRSSCEGYDADRPTFFIFRFRDPVRPPWVEAFVTGMNSIENVRCGAEVGNMGFWRVGVTTDLWYTKDADAFTHWWNRLALNIRVALEVNQALLPT